MQSSSPSCPERDDPKRAVPTRWVQATTDGTGAPGRLCVCVQEFANPRGLPSLPVSLSACSLLHKTSEVGAIHLAICGSLPTPRLPPLPPAASPARCSPSILDPEESGVYALPFWPTESTTPSGCLDKSAVGRQGLLGSHTGLSHGAFPILSPLAAPDRGGGEALRVVVPLHGTRSGPPRALVARSAPKKRGAWRKAFS